MYLIVDSVACGRRKLAFCSASGTLATLCLLQKGPNGHDTVLRRYSTDMFATFQLNPSELTGKLLEPINIPHRLVLLVPQL
jgi:hypothetical protein